MKFYVIFALALATVSVSAFDLRNAVLKQQHNIPVMESEGRIYNGIKARVGQFPYQVGLLITLKDKVLSWCSGSLISRTYVLTAAHCLQQAQSLVLYFGATKRTSPEKKVTVDKANFIIHEDYNHNNARNDIALIKFKAITYTNKIQPIALPHDISCGNPTLVGRNAVIAGWGRAVENGNVVEDLQYIVMPIMSNAECAQMMGGNIFDTTICISNRNGSSPCRGDSGGPLVLSSEKYLVGLDSFGSSRGCGKDGPTAFARVYSFMPWIRNHTGIGS